MTTVPIWFMFIVVGLASIGAAVVLWYLMEFAFFVKGFLVARKAYFEKENAK